MRRRSAPHTTTLRCCVLFWKTRGVKNNTLPRRGCTAVVAGNVADGGATIAVGVKVVAPMTASNVSVVTVEEVIANQ